MAGRVPDDKGDVENCADLGEELNMSKDKANPLRRRNRAVTLIEAVLYISIALALIVGGLVFFQQASTAAKTSTMARQLSATFAEIRALRQGAFPTTNTPFNITPYLIAAGAVSPDMLAPISLSNPYGLTNPFGGSTNFWYLPSYGGSAPVMAVEVSNIPKGVCARLLTATSGSGYIAGSGGAGGTTLVSSGYIAGNVYNIADGTDRNYVMNPTQAGWMCKYGSTAYGDQTTEPNSTPLSGDVSIFMVFLLLI
jgi:hypothetical protein